MSIWSTDTHNKLKTWKKGLIFVGEKWEQKKKSLHDDDDE